MSSLRNHHGFTKVELIVVLFILGLFVGVCVPVFSMWSDKAADAQCRQNLLSIGSALNAYGVDHEGVWPQLAGERSSKSQQVPVMDIVLAEYVDDQSVFRCPGDDNDVYTRTGCSYRWDFYPEAMKEAGGIPDLSQVEFKVESRPMLLHRAIVLDKEPFHKTKSHANGLYLRR